MPLSYQVVPNLATGAVLTESWVDIVADDVNLAGDPPRARVLGITQSIANNTPTGLLFAGSETYDSDTIHDLVTNTGILTCKTPGLYLVGCQVEFAANATGSRTLTLYRGGTSVLDEDRRPAMAAGTTSLRVLTVFPLLLNEFFSATVTQDSGGALNVITRDFHSPAFWMHRIG